MSVEIAENKHAWGQLSESHYHTFKQRFADGTHQLNPHILAEIGDLTGKRVIHLQCNTGADTILLARLGAAEVVGVDLVPDNIRFATQLAADLGVSNVRFVESDIMKIMDLILGKFDVVFTSEGALGWLPDLGYWGRAIRNLLDDDGYLYAFEGHPIYLMFDEGKLAQGEVAIKYPYFERQPDLSESIGGYAGDSVSGVRAHFWMYQISDLINSLTDAGLHINYFHEFVEQFFDPGGAVPVGPGLYNYPFNTGLFPQSFSLKATVYPRII